MLLNVIKKPHKVVTNNKGNNTSTNLQRNEFKISWLHRSLYICNVSDWSLPMKETQYTDLFHKTLRLRKLFSIANLINLRVFLVFYINEVRHNCSKRKQEKKNMKKNSGKVAKFLCLVVQTHKCSPKKCPQHVFLF